MVSIQLSVKEEKVLRIPKDALGSIYRNKIYRLTRDLPGLGLSEGTVFLWIGDDGIYHIHEMGIDSALRACMLTVSGYGWRGDSGISEGELADLSQFAAGNWHLWHVLLDWKAMSPKEREEYRSICQDLAYKLTHVRNQHKLLAYGRTQRATSVADSLGRTNPTSRQALHAWSAKRIELRRDQVQRIAPRIDIRKAYLVEAIERNLDTVRRALATIQRIDERLKIARAPVNLTGIRELLKRVAGELRKTHDRPWFHAFRRTANDLEWASTRLLRGTDFDPDAARERIQRGIQSIEQLEYYRQLADLQLSISLGLARRPRHSPELVYLLQELRAFWKLIEHVDDSDFDNPIMTRVRKGVAKAGHLWVNGDYKAAKLALREAAAPF